MQQCKTGKTESLQLWISTNTRIFLWNRISKRTKNGLSDPESGSGGPTNERVGGVWNFSPQISAGGYFSSQLCFNLFVTLLGVLGAAGSRSSALVLKKVTFFDHFRPQNLLGWSAWVLILEFFYFMLFSCQVCGPTQCDVLGWNLSHLAILGFPFLGQFSTFPILQNLFWGDLPGCWLVIFFILCFLPAKCMAQLNVIFWFGFLDILATFGQPQMWPICKPHFYEWFWKPFCPIWKF